MDFLLMSVYCVNKTEKSCFIYQSDYRNIGKHLDAMGIKWITNGFRHGKKPFDSVSKQYQDPPKEKERRDRNEICRLKGLARKKIILYENHVLLTFSGGESKISLGDITKVDFRICTKTQVGYLRLRYPGSDSRKKPENDDASIIWEDAELNASAQNLKKIIERHILQKSSKPKSTSATPFSVADEIIKLKSLLDAGVITQEEFDRQKAKLLK